MKPVVTVLMPIYNGESYLDSAINSVLGQTYQAWELLCLDDGSSDNSRAIIQRFSDRDDRIQLIKLDHRGIVSALNHGVKQAQTKFIARLDADDIALPSRFELQIQYLERHPEVALVGGSYQTIRADGSVWKDNIPPLRYQDVLARLPQSNCIAHPAVMMRRSVLDQFEGPYREWFPFAEDYDLWLRMSVQHRLENLPDILLQYRRDFANPRPARTVTQAISTLAASFVHRLRRDGMIRDDQLSMPFDEQRLIVAGCPVARIHEVVRKALLSEARASAKAGFPAQAQILIREAKKVAPKLWQVRDCVDFLWKVTQVRVA